MKRMSGETRTNPYDLFALETALAIREKTGGTGVALTADFRLRRKRDDPGCLYHGCDEGVILSVTENLQERMFWQLLMR